MFAALAAVLLASSSLVSVYPDTTALHHQVQAGTLLQNHGVIATCDVCDSEVVTVAQGSATPLTTPVPIGYSAAELAAAYHLPTSDGATGTVAIVDGGGYPSFEDDLAKYRSQFALPPCIRHPGA